MAAKPTVERRGDHDLIVQMNEGMKYLQQDMTVVKADIKELKDNTASRVENLEREKADKAETELMKKQIDGLKTKVNLAYGGIALASFGIPLVIYAITK